MVLTSCKVWRTLAKLTLYIMPQLANSLQKKHQWQTNNLSLVINYINPVHTLRSMWGSGLTSRSSCRQSVRSTKWSSSLPASVCTQVSQSLLTDVLWNLCNQWTVWIVNSDWNNKMLRIIWTYSQSSRSIIHRSYFDLWCGYCISGLISLLLLIDKLVFHLSSWKH